VAADLKQLSLAIITVFKGGLTMRCSGGHEALFKWLLVMSLVAPLNAGVRRLDNGDEPILGISLLKGLALYGSFALLSFVPRDFALNFLPLLAI
jgi:hypothetical protein